MPVGSVNYSNNAVSFGKKPHIHLNDRQKRTAAVLTTGIATGAAITAGVVYRKNIGAFIGKMFKSMTTMFKHKTGKLKGLPSPQTVSTARQEAMQGAKEQVKVNMNFKEKLSRLAGKAKKGTAKAFHSTVDFFKSLPGKIKGIFVKPKNTMPAAINKK